MRSATVRQPGEGRTVAVVGDVYRFLATGDDTGGRYAQWEAVVPPGGGPPPHIHSREEESFFVLEGEITFTVNGRRLVAGPGEFASMPVGVSHAFRNETGARARMLITIAPAGLEQMFLEVGRPVDFDGGTLASPTPEEIAALLAAAPRYGVEILHPADDSAAASAAGRTEK